MNRANYRTFYEPIMVEGLKRFIVDRVISFDQAKHLTGKSHSGSEKTDRLKMS